MAWWRRTGRESSPAPDAGGAGHPMTPAAGSGSLAPAPAPAPSEWRRLPPLQRSLAPIDVVAPLAPFVGGLATRRDPRFVAPLGHARRPDAPSGEVGLVAQRSQGRDEILRDLPVLRAAGSARSAAPSLQRSVTFPGATSRLGLTVSGASSGPTSTPDAAVNHADSPSGADHVTASTVHNAFAGTRADDSSVAALKSVQQSAAAPVVFDEEAVYEAVAVQPVVDQPIENPMEGPPVPDAAGLLGDSTPTTPAYVPSAHSAATPVGVQAPTVLPVSTSSSQGSRHTLQRATNPTERHPPAPPPQAPIDPVLPRLVRESRVVAESSAPEGPSHTAPLVAAVQRRPITPETVVPDAELPLGREPASAPIESPVSPEPLASVPPPPGGPTLATAPTLGAGNNAEPSSAPPSSVTPDAGWPATARPTAKLTLGGQAAPTAAVVQRFSPVTEANVGVAPVGALFDRWSDGRPPLPAVSSDRVVGDRSVGSVSDPPADRLSSISEAPTLAAGTLAEPLSGPVPPRVPTSEPPTRPLLQRRRVPVLGRGAGQADHAAPPLQRRLDNETNEVRPARPVPPPEPLVLRQHWHPDDLPTESGEQRPIDTSSEPATAPTLGAVWEPGVGFQSAASRDETASDTAPQSWTQTWSQPPPSPLSPALPTMQTVRRAPEQESSAEPAPTPEPLTVMSLQRMFLQGASGRAGSAAEPTLQTATAGDAPWAHPDDGRRNGDVFPRRVAEPGSEGDESTQTSAAPSNHPALQRDSHTETTSSEPVAASPEAPTPSATVPGATAGTGVDIDDLARRLFDPLSARLRAELWLDRERAGLIADLRR